MLRTKVLACVSALFLCIVSVAGYANPLVIGQLKAESSLMLNPGANQYRIGKDSTAYMQGDIVRTNPDSSALLTLGSTGGSLTIAPNSLVSIDMAEPVVINLRSGGIGFSVSAGDELSIVSPKGEFTVASDSGASGVAVYKDGELAIISNRGNIVVNTQSGDAVTVVNEQNAFVITRSNQSQVVNVQLGGNASFWSKYKWWFAAFAAVSAGLIIDNNSGSSSNPPASPAN